MVEQVKNKFSKQTIILIILLFTALFSNLVVSRIVTAPDFNAATIKSLDDKKATVMKLSVAAAASSTALSLIPGDAAMPIANQIAQLTSYFIIILGAILLEKMLVAVVGYLAFTVIIPAACALGIAYLYIKKDFLKNLAIKLGLFGIILFAAIPVSIKVSDLIYDSYQVSIEQTMETAKQNNEFIEEKKKDLSTEDQNWMEKVGDYLSNLTSKIGNDISTMIKKGENTLSVFLDTIAVLIITSCVIPVVVILIFAWIIKISFSFESKGLSTISSKKSQAIDKPYTWI
jgi:predicted RNA-binding protein Jag